MNPRWSLPLILVLAAVVLVPPVTANIASPASISGTVTNGTGPLSGVSVTASGDAGYGFATTDAGGQYTISGLAAGSYKLRFQDQLGRGYISEWWNDKASYASADPIGVDAGAALTGKDAVLALGGSISGRVLGSGAPLAGVFVHVQDATTLMPFEPSAPTDAEGHYVITGLPPGSYTVDFQQTDDYLGQFYKGRDTLDSADPVTVSGTENKTLDDVELVRGGVISGTVTGAGGPVAGAQVLASSLDSQDDIIGAALTGPDGQYTLKPLPTGTYKIQFAASGFVPEWWDDKAAYAVANQISVSVGQTVTGKDAFLSPTATISGTVSSGGQPVASILVQAYTLTSGGSGNAASFALTAPDGTYTIGGLAGGDYRLRFSDWTGKYVPEWWDNQGDFASATTVSVAAAGSATGKDADLALDSTAPDTFITSAPYGSTTSATAVVYFGSNEQVHYECKLDSASFGQCAQRMTFSGLSQGTHTVAVRAIDNAGNVDATPATHSWTVDPDDPNATITTEGTLPPGGSLLTQTDPLSYELAATPAQPVALELWVSPGGHVTVADNPTGTSPSGFELFGRRFDITAPAASASEPLVLQFAVDYSVIPAGMKLADVKILRDGVVVPDCVSRFAQAADPDPCVRMRSRVLGGDFEFWVASSHASAWTFARQVGTPGGGGSTDNGGGGSTTTATTTTQVTQQSSGTPPAQVATPSKPRVKTCVVPKLVGKTLAKAKTLIKKAGCKLGKVTRKAAGRKLRGKVVSQTPKAGRRVAAGTKVKLVLGR